MLEWNVYVEDINGKRMCTHNIFDHYRFRSDCKKAAKKYGKDREQFEETVRRDLMYYYWSKCEWEIVLSPWVGNRESFREEKIDVYDQVKLNWDIFIDWLWNNRKELLKDEDKDED